MQESQISCALPPDRHPALQLSPLPEPPLVQNPTVVRTSLRILDGITVQYMIRRPPRLCLQAENPLAKN